MRKRIKTLKGFINTIINHLFPIRFKNLDDLISAAYSFDYKISIREKFYSDALSQSFIPRSAYQGGLTILELRGVKQNCFDIVCDISLGRFDPFLGKTFFDRKKEIIQSLIAMNVYEQPSVNANG